MGAIRIHVFGIGAKAYSGTFPGAVRRRAETMAKVSPAQFVRQVRQEVSRVTWASRKETAVATLMVFIMVFLASVFFFVVDQVLAWGVQLVLGLGG